MQKGDVRIPLPPYPSSPASLAAAMTFYNAARQEINERVKFRDQVLITIIAATFAFIAFVDPLGFAADPDASPLFGTKARTDGALLLISAIVVTAVIEFAGRYGGYQNAKIAELGFFITSGPAFHLQAYGHVELLADAIADEEFSTRPEILLLKQTNPKLRETFSHWDGWAADHLEFTDESRVVKKTEPPEEHEDVIKKNKKIKELKKKFSNDSVYSLLITSFSFLPLAMTLLVAGRVYLSEEASFYMDPFFVGFMAMAALIGIAVCVRARIVIGQAQSLKDHYSRLRKSVDVNKLFQE